MLPADPTFVLVLAAGFLAVAGVGWVVTAPSAGDAAKKRARSVTGRARIRGKRQTSALDAAAQRRRQVQESLKEMEERQRTVRRRAITLKARIQQAGFDFDERTFWIVSVIVGLAAGGIAIAAGQTPLIAAGVAIGVGLTFPQWVLGFLRNRRLKRFSAGFANAIDVIVRGVKSGLPLNECLIIIGNESPEPVGGEFRALAEEQAMGVTLEEGLRRMYERIPLPELNFFAVVISIQQKTGGNLAEALNNLATVLRSRRMMKEKIGALSSEAKASAAIIGVLPPGVGGLVYLTSPDYILLLFTEPMGKVMLLGGFTWMAIGVFIMKRMISFKV